MGGKVSIVIPCFNAEASLGPCLESVFALEAAGGIEVIVVDDGSAAIAARYPCRRLSPGSNRGAAHARNRGAEAARGEILFFVDADVVLPADALTLVREAFERSAADCVVGVFSADNPFTDFFSQYKSLYTNWKYQALDGASAVNTAVAAMRRRVFDALGGFDEGMSTVEDNEFGDRVFRHGFKIVIERRIEVLHLKRFSMLGLLRNDYVKSAGLADMLFAQVRDGRFSARREFTDISAGLMLNVPLAAATLAAGLVGALAGSGAAWAAAALLAAAFLAHNGGFWVYLARRKGVRFVALAAPFTFLTYVVVGVAVAGGLRALLGRRTHGAPPS